MKLDKLRDHVRERLEHTGSKTEVTDALLGFIVIETVLGMGFHFNQAGEICDPRPAASTVPRQQNVRWAGGRRRR